MANVDVFIKRDFESFSFFSKSENTTLSIANDISGLYGKTRIAQQGELM